MLTNRDRHCANGFTLIEMLVMIIIIAVLTGVAVPRYLDFAVRARFQESVQRVLSVFSYARYRAIESGSDCIVRYDPQSATFIVEAEAPLPDADQPVALQEAPESLSASAREPLILGENITVGDFQIEDPQQRPRSRGRAVEVRFYEDGRADAALMMLQGSEGERAIIEISPLTGRAALRDDLL